MSWLRPRGSPALSDPDLVHPPGKARRPRSTIPRLFPPHLAGRSPQQGVAISCPSRGGSLHQMSFPFVRIQRGLRPLGSALVPAGGRRRGLGGAGDETPLPGALTRRRAAARNTVLCRPPPAPAGAPPPFPCSPGRGPVGGAPELALATAKQGQVQTDRELANGGRGVWWVSVSTPRAAAVSEACCSRPLSLGGHLLASWWDPMAFSGRWPVTQGQGFQRTPDGRAPLCNGVTWTCPSSCPQSPWARPDVCNTSSSR